MKTSLTIKGTHCAACKTLIEDIASEIPGISSCTVDHVSGKTVVDHDESIDWSKLKQEVEASGPYTFESPY